MRKKLCFAIIAALLLFPTIAIADDVVGWGSYVGAWQTWVAGDLNEDLSPYWDGNSSDPRNNYTVGNYLTNTGAFAGGTGPGVAYPYWGTADGGSDPFYMKRTSGSNNVAFKVEVSGYATQNTFGYYDTAYHPLFGGSAVPGDSTTFTPIGDYYFYLLSPDGLFRSIMSDNEQYQHFAIFKEGDGKYWLGMEDLINLESSDRDYNDMIVRISQVSVPEPTTMLLLGLGLVGLAGIRRRMRK